MLRSWSSSLGGLEGQALEALATQAVHHHRSTCAQRRREGSGGYGEQAREGRGMMMIAGTVAGRMTSMIRSRRTERCRCTTAW